MFPNGENNISIVFAVSILIILDILLMTMLKKRKKLTLVFILTIGGHIGFGQIGTKDYSNSKNNI